MNEITLDVQIRNEIGTRKVKAVRRQDAFPAIVYGGDRGPTPIRVDRRTFQKILRLHRGQNIVFHLNVLEGDKKLRDYSALVQEKQYHPVSDQLTHVDFKRISLTDKITVKVAVETKGEAIGVKQDGGSLDHALWEVELECLPTNIPKKIDLNVESLNIGEAIHVKELAVPPGSVFKTDPEAIVVSVVPPMREVEASDEEAESAEPEVTKEKKKDAPEATNAG